MNEAYDNIIGVENELKRELKMNTEEWGCWLCCLAIFCYFLFWEKK
jgi:hypothetical protein